MKSVLQPWQLLLPILAGWINRHQQEVLEYLRAENQVLKLNLGKKRILLTDDQRRRLAIKGRDSKHCQAFRELVEQSGPRCIRLPPRSPNLQAHLERFIRSIKEECLDRMILFGDRSLRNAAQEFISHYHAERNHQGLDNRIIEPGDDVSCRSGKIACRERLVGMLRHY